MRPNLPQSSSTNPILIFQASRLKAQGNTIAPPLAQPYGVDANWPS